MIQSAVLQEEEGHVAALFTQNDGSPERVLAGLVSDLFGSKSLGKGKPTEHFRCPRHSQAFVAGEVGARALRLLLSRALLRQLPLKHVLDTFDLLGSALRLHFANREAARHAGAVRRAADLEQLGRAVLVRPQLQGAGLRGLFVPVPARSATYDRDRAGAPGALRARSAVRA